jgi:hypothetical protein
MFNYLEKNKDKRLEIITYLSLKVWNSSDASLIMKSADNYWISFDYKYTSMKILKPQNSLDLLLSFSEI